MAEGDSLPRSENGAGDFSVPQSMGSWHALIPALREPETVRKEGGARVSRLVIANSSAGTSLGGRSRARSACTALAMS